MRYLNKLTPQDNIQGGLLIRGTVLANSDREFPVQKITRSQALQFSTSTLIIL
jgi:hypothetical protein